MLLQNISGATCVMLVVVLQCHCCVAATLVVLLQCQWCYCNINVHFRYLGTRQLNGFLFVIVGIK
jgi:hypothetical protein